MSKRARREDEMRKTRMREREKERGIFYTLCVIHARCAKKAGLSISKRAFKLDILLNDEL